MASPSSSSGPPRVNPRAVSLRLIVVFVTCCAIALGMIWHWPGIVPIAVIAAIIALARTWTLLRTSGAATNSPMWKTWAFALLGSLGIVSLVGAASSAAFLAVCFPLGATQTNYSKAPAVPVLDSASWVLGGAAGAGVAAGMLELLWFGPWSRWPRVHVLPTLKERIVEFFRVATPPLSAIFIGGLCSLFPAAFAVLVGPLKSLASVAAFVACLAAFIGGGWLGVVLARKFPQWMTGLLAFGVGMPAAFVLLSLIELVLHQDPFLEDGAAALGVWKPLWVFLGGLFAIAATFRVLKWTQQPE